MTTMHADLFSGDIRAAALKEGWFTGCFVAPWLRIWDSPRGQTCIHAFDTGTKWQARFSPAGPFQDIDPQDGETREAAALALIQAAERAR